MRVDVGVDPEVAEPSELLNDIAMARVGTARGWPPARLAGRRRAGTNAVERRPPRAVGRRGAGLARGAGSPRALRASAIDQNRQSVRGSSGRVAGVGHSVPSSGSSAGVILQRAVARRGGARRPVATFPVG
jgi:hypothetical protein